MGLSGTQVKIRSGNENYFPGKVGIGILPSEQLTVGGNISATGGIHSTGGISTDTYFFSPNYLGIWSGDPLSSNQVNIEGGDFRLNKSATKYFRFNLDDGIADIDVADDLRLDPGGGNVYVDGNITASGQLIGTVDGGTF